MASPHARGDQGTRRRRLAGAVSCLSTVLFMASTLFPVPRGCPYSAFPFQGVPSCTPHSELAATAHGHPRLTSLRAWSAALAGRAACGTRARATGGTHVAAGHQLP